MATMADASFYTKGSLLGSDKEWYHGDLSRVEAEQALTVLGYDCFLIREDRGALVLSLLHNGNVHHMNVKYGPGWYELESGLTEYSFTELDDLIDHYSNNIVNVDVGVTLGQACKKINSDISTEIENTDEQLHGYASIGSAETILSHHYDIIDTTPVTDPAIYSRGDPEDLAQFSWYHGHITEEHAEVALSIGNYNKFLIRQSGTNLLLSMRINGWKSHIVIHRNPNGYHLDEKEKIFQTIPQLIAYYQQFPIDDNRNKTLGTPVDSQFPGLKTNSAHPPSSIFRKKMTQPKISWRRCMDLPVPISTPQVVKIQDHIYVGGGMRNQGDSNIVYQYSLSRDTWRALPHCTTRQHGLATLDNEIITIGGKMDGETTNAMCTFRNNTWQEVLPPMPTPRYLLSTVSHDNRLILVAGGTTCMKRNGESQRTNVVEVYIKDKMWLTTRQLPFPTSIFSISIVDSVCYILGGATSNDAESCTTLCATISSLLGYGTPAAGNKKTATQIETAPWNQLPGIHPLTFPSLVEFGGRLTAVGGSWEPMLRRGTKYVSAYESITDTWVQCKGAELPVPLYRTGVVKLEADEVMVVGGQSKSQRFSAAVFIGGHLK